MAIWELFIIILSKMHIQLETKKISKFLLLRVLVRDFTNARTKQDGHFILKSSGSLRKISRFHNFVLFRH